MRRALLEIAGQVLLEDGVHALSTRKLSERAGASTTAIYTLFGGKEGLLEALYIEGFARLGEAIRAVDATLEPLERLRVMNHTYRQLAIEHPRRYALMFEQVMLNHTHSEAALERAWQSMQPLIEAIQIGMDANVIERGDAEALAMKFWVGAHGLVSLELAGYFRFQPELAITMHEQNISSLNLKNS